MSDYKDNDRIDELRERLYSRGAPTNKRERFNLSPRETEKEDLKELPPTLGPRGERKAVDIRKGHEQKSGLEQAMPDEAKTEVTPEDENKREPYNENGENEPILDPTLKKMATKKKRRMYRIKILLASMAIFVLSAVIATLVLMKGSNTISGDNIDIEVDAPFAIGGGEVIPLEVKITNRNSVDIESATLIVDYPSGTQSPTEDGKELFSERLALELIASGETVTVPVRARIFGDQDDEKVINTSIEYRVRGSNATFFKPADPVTFKISSSPVIVSAESIKRVASGQEFAIDVTVSSNASDEITNVLVVAEYPSSYDVSESIPEPDSGQNTWIIESLEPGESTVITIRGIVVGNEGERSTTKFTIGVPNERDQYSLASEFSSATTEFVIEQPFLGVVLSMAGDSDGTAVSGPGSDVSGSITLDNSLESEIYDAVVKATLSGNALDDASVRVERGFYDSTTRTITWDQSTYSELASIASGVSRRLSFEVTPRSDVARTPQIDISVDARARRTRERDVSEELIGTASGKLQVETDVTLRSELTHGTAIFTDRGPIPPIVGEKTTYTATLLIENTTNEVGDAEVTTSLPPYVSWLSVTEGDGEFSYNATSRDLTWTVSRVEPESFARASFQLEFLPSSSQLGATPTLLGSQRLRATDRFTGSVVRDTEDELNTELSSEAGFTDEDSIVVSEHIEEVADEEAQ